MEKNRRELPNEQDGLFIGRNAVTELLKSGRQVDRVLIRRGERDGSLSPLCALALAKGVPLLETDVRKLDALSGGGAHQGVLAYAAETAYLSVQELLEKTEEAGQEPFYVLLDGVSDPHNHGVWIWAVEMGGTPYEEQDFRGKIALLLGSEGEGVSRLLREQSDFLTGIPMYGKINSLNVSNAAAVVLFEAARQRNRAAKG